MKRWAIALGIALTIAGSATVKAQRSGTVVGTAEPRDSPHAICVAAKNDVQTRIYLRSMYVRDYVGSDAYYADIAERDSYNC